MSTSMSYEAKPETIHLDEAAKAGHALAAEKEAHTKNPDLGAEWLKTYTGPEVDITDEESTRIRRKIDTHIMPL